MYMIDAYIVYNNLFNHLFIKFYKLYLNDFKKDNIEIKEQINELKSETQI